MTCSQSVFDQAVRLAAALVANGEIRFSGTTDQDAEAMDLVADLIPALCAALERERGMVGRSRGHPAGPVAGFAGPRAPGSEPGRRWKWLRRAL